MALSPLKPRSSAASAAPPAPRPSRTYALDFAGGQLENRLIDGEEALRQAVEKALWTARFRYLACDWSYGSELERLIGEDLTPELMRSEVPRVIREALLADDRVLDVVDFALDSQGDRLSARFAVVHKDGLLQQEVTLLV